MLIKAMLLAGSDDQRVSRQSDGRPVMLPGRAVGLMVGSGRTVSGTDGRDGRRFRWSVGRLLGFTLEIDMM